MFDKVVICSECGKDFLYFGDPKEDEEVFCSPDCIEKSHEEKMVH